MADPEQPTAPPDKTLPRPINTGKIALYFMMGFAGLVMLSNITHLGSSPKMPRSAQTTKPTAPDGDTITGFEQQQKADIEKLKKEAEKLLAGTPVGSSSIPPCDASLAGTRATAPDGTAVTCELDGTWRRAAVAADSVNGSSALTPEQQEAQRRKAEREKREQLALASSTVAVDFSDQNARQNAETAATSAPPATSNPAAVQHAGNPDSAPSRAKRDWFSYTGKLHRIFEGTIFETVLTNRINGSFAGPINTMLTTNVYSHDHQTLLIPQGTRCLGNVSAVNSSNQQRLYVAFHRCIMPDGYPLDLDKFPGLNQVGETALCDLVNHHYLQIFGTSLAVGAIGGVAQIGNSSSAFAYDPGVALRNGVTQETSQEAMRILDHFLNQLPTFTVRERTRVKIYISADLELPAYDAHIIDPAI